MKNGKGTCSGVLALLLLLRILFSSRPRCDTIMRSTLFTHRFHGKALKCRLKGYCLRTVSEFKGNDRLRAPNLKIALFACGVFFKSLVLNDLDREGDELLDNNSEKCTSRSAGMSSASTSFLARCVSVNIKQTRC